MVTQGGTLTSGASRDGEGTMKTSVRNSRVSRRAETGGGRLRILVPGCAVVVLLAGLATWLVVGGGGRTSDAGQFKGGPRIAVDQDLIDFGDVPFRKFVEASFRVRNVGDQPLALPAAPPLDVLEGC
jgi:hypothetical protein